MLNKVDAHTLVTVEKQVIHDFAVSYQAYCESKECKARDLAVWARILHNKQHKLGIELIEDAELVKAFGGTNG